MTKRTQKFVNTPAPLRLNGKHKVVIRLGAMHDSISIDGHETDMSRREDEDFKDYLGRRQRAVNDLNGMIFS